MFDRKTIWLLLFLLSVFGSSSAHAFLGKNRIGDFTPEHSSLYDLRRSAEDIRTQITNSDGVITYITDPHGALSCVLSRTQNGQTKRYVYGVGLQYEVDSNGSAIYYHFDHVGNTAALTDESEAVIDEFRYSPYGTVTYQKNDYETPFQFGGFFGIQTDSNGLVHMRARYFNPLIRRFVNSDPARDAWNWFAYAGGNPVSFVDPTGFAANLANDSSGGGNLESLGFNSNASTEIRSPEWMRATIPGQVAWDNARTDFSNGNIVSGAVNTGLMLGEIGLTIFTLGEAQAIRTGTQTTIKTTNSFSDATFNSFQRQAQQHGQKSLLKSQSKIQRRLTEHQEKLLNIRKAGGNTSSVEREIRTFQNQLDAISEVLKKGN